MFGLTQQDIDSIKKRLSRYPNVEKAIIFGSRAMGNYKPGSDIDIALIGPDLDDLVSTIGGVLNEEIPLPYEFDVVSLSSLTNDALLDHIRRVGILFYSK